MFFCMKGIGKETGSKVIGFNFPEWRLLLTVDLPKANRSEVYFDANTSPQDRLALKRIDYG